MSRDDIGNNLVQHMVDYLLDRYFSSKRALAAELNIPYRAILRLYQGENSDTVLMDLPLHCPKCKRETIVNIIEFKIKTHIEPDA